MKTTTKKFRTWGRKGGTEYQVCEVSATSKKQARQKFNDWGIEMQDKNHIWS